MNPSPSTRLSEQTSRGYIVRNDIDGRTTAGLGTHNKVQIDAGAEKRDRTLAIKV